MRILFLIKAMPKGGAERVIANLCNYLADNNEVILSTFSNTKIEYNLSDKITTVYLDREYSKKSIRGFIGRFKIIKIIKRIVQLNRIKKKYKIEIVISFLPIPCYYALFSNYFFKTKNIISVRNDPKQEYKGFINKILMKWLYPKADNIVFQTNDALKYFSPKIQKKGIIIPNPLNEEFIEDDIAKIRNKNIVSVGRLSKQKNQKMILEAFYKISEIYKEYTLTIYGEGELRNELEELVEKYELSNRVSLPGKTENVKEKIKNACMFILSSDYEGMPNSLMEAMALGIPCISTDCPCGGPKYLISNNYNGILIPTKDINELVKAMEKIINDKDFSKKISENAHSIVHELAPEKIYSIWLELLKNI